MPPLPTEFYVHVFLAVVCIWAGSFGLYTTIRILRDKR